MSKPNKPRAEFPGFRSPNYTPVPDELFDELLPELSGSELKVLLYIIRRTFGFKRESDTISLSQMLNGITRHDGRVLDRGAGVSKPTLLKCLRSLQDRRIIFADRNCSEHGGHEPTSYRPNIVLQPLGKGTYPPLVKKVDQGGGKESSPSPRSTNLTTQDTVEQETEEQRTVAFENSNLRKVVTEETSSSNPGTGGKPKSTNEPQVVGDILGRAAHVPSRSRARPETLDEDYQRIQDCIIDRAREFYDTASIKSSTTRAYRMYQRSGMSVERFIDHIFQARAITQERTGSITKMTEGSDYEAERKTKMAYFFAVLEDHLRLSGDRPARGGADASV